MKKEIQQKIASCKALQGKTISDLCHTDQFLQNLAAYMNAQKTDRNAIQASYQAMRKMGGAKGFKLPAHPIDRVIDLTAEQFRDEFCSCIAATNPRPSAQREYILQLGMQAYNLTVGQFVVKEFPELKDVIFPTTKQS